MKWRSGKGGSMGGGGAVIKYFPHPFAFEDFWEIVPAICAAPNSPTWLNVQPFLRFFLHGWILPISPLVARGLAACSAGFSLFLCF